MVITFDWRVLLTKYAPKYTYLGTPNMVKWGVPEKILQNAVADALVLGL